MKLAIFNFFLFVTCVSCSFSQKIKDGEMAYERKQFSVASDLLSEEFENTKNQSAKARKAFLLGKSLIKLQEYNEAIIWFKKAVELNFGPEAIGNLASTYKSIENYDLAIVQYEKLKEITGRIQENDREILVCKQAKLTKNGTKEYFVDKIFENTTTSDYAPVLYDDNFIIFTSERKEASGGIYNWTGEKYSDLFIMLKTGSDVRRFDSALNTGQNEGSSWFTRDNNTMYFTRCYNFTNGDDFCKIMTSERINGIWSDPEVLPFIQEKINYGQPTLIENDSVLVFTADIVEPGGPTDLYYAELFSDGTWSQPDKLPSSINTQGNEKFPTGDRDTLYFSSDYLPGLGGYDIYKTYLKNDGSWSFPINMGYGINSGGDDFSFIVDYGARKLEGIEQVGYFVSNRRGETKDDIYRFEKHTVVKKPQDTIKEVTKNVYLTVKTFFNTFQETDNPNSALTGRSPFANVFVKVVNEQNQKIFEGYTDKNGFLLTEIPKDNQFTITASKVGYLNSTKKISSKNIIFPKGENTFTINTELVLDKIFADQEINLANIYYDFDKWDITNASKPTLDALAKILEDNPQINIQLSSHTDCRGEDDYNQDLSQKRAQSVVDYLITAKIAPSRLIAKGYGESSLIETCACATCTEEQHQINRRTTFKILTK